MHIAYYFLPILFKFSLFIIFYSTPIFIHSTASISFYFVLFNVVNSENKDKAQLLWKAILKQSISSETSNRARVYNNFMPMVDVGIHIPEDIITDDLIKRLPNSLKNIKQIITHSCDGEDIKPKKLHNHLGIHLNALKVSLATKGEVVATSMYTSDNQKFLGGQHNPNSKTHTKEKKKEEAQFSSYSTFSSISFHSRFRIFIPHLNLKFAELNPTVGMIKRTQMRRMSISNEIDVSESLVPTLRNYYSNLMSKVLFYFPPWRRKSRFVLL
ncbi:hypothetical protein VP01_4335g1 [Puccinia sorghi]|uniref:Uncharacterized protein n=1 Tax=Puccinia sorghi TaxID=27349 RepID=A0A0L6URY0_9BASI|nr:hypothetical protein VP01_4335g1 [Puccinia sorghi]